MSVKQKPLKIKVTFPNGKIICYAIVERTLIETLKEIGSDRFNEIHLEVGHLPLISKEKYTKYGDWMKPIADGWYINTQSDTNQKYMQLIAIKSLLNLDITIELGRDFETQSSKTGKTRGKQRDTLRVIIGDEIDVTTEPYYVYFGVLQKIGFEAIRKKNILIQDKKIVTSTNQYGSVQIQTNEFLWVTMPPKESLVIKWLGIVTSIMNFKVTLIDVIHNKEYQFPRGVTTTNKPANTIIVPRRRNIISRTPLQMLSDSAPIVEQKEPVPIDKISRRKLIVSSNDTVFHVGDIILHNIWGIGIIKEITLNGALFGVKFRNMNLTYVEPQTIELIDKKEIKKIGKKGLENITPFMSREKSSEKKYSSEKLVANAKLIRRLMRTGGIALGGIIYSPKYGPGTIKYLDSFCIKASFNNVIETLHIGKDYIQI